MVSPVLGSAQLLELFRKAGELCSSKLSVYMIGGGAMAIRNEKRATKDVDIILPSQSQATEITMAFSDMGINVNMRPAQAIGMGEKENDEGAADIFVGKICNGLRFSDGMRDRAELFEKIGNIDLYLLSREDIFS